MRSWDHAGACGREGRHLLQVGTKPALARCFPHATCVHAPRPLPAGRARVHSPFPPLALWGAQGGLWSRQWSGG